MGYLKIRYKLKKHEKYIALVRYDKKKCKSLIRNGLKSPPYKNAIFKVAF